MPALLLAITGLDRAAIKVGAALATGVLLALTFAVSSIAALFGAVDAGSAQNGPIPAQAALVAPAPVSLATAGGNAAVLRALVNLGSQRWHDAQGNSLCEQFVENMYGTTGQYSTAISAWQAQAPRAADQLGQQRDLALAPLGAKMYFFDPHQPSGHTGIYTGNGAFIAANDNGVQYWNVNSWDAVTGQSLLGWVAP